MSLPQVLLLDRTLPCITPDLLMVVVTLTGRLSGVCECVYCVRSSAACNQAAALWHPRTHCYRLAVGCRWQHGQSGVLSRAYKIVSLTVTAAATTVVVSTPSWCHPMRFVAAVLVLDIVRIAWLSEWDHYGRLLGKA